MNQHEKRPENVNDASARNTSLVSRSVIITVVFALILILYTLFQPHGMIVEFSETALSVTDPDGQVLSFNYSDIRSVEQMESPIYGTLTTGRQSSTCWYGRYHNMLWEDYTLCIHPNCPLCVVISTDDGVFVFNGLNEEETVVYTDTLLKMTGSASA